jgi:single-strand DNA-binding protein
MSNTINKVILVGHLGRNPEVKTFDNGGKLANFSMATKEIWKDAKGDRQEQTEWHNIVVRKSSSLTFTEQYLKKGMLVYVEGKLRSRSYKSKTGDERTVLEVFAEDVQLLSNTKKEEKIPTNTELVEETEF